MYDLYSFSKDIVDLILWIVCGILRTVLNINSFCDWLESDNVVGVLVYIIQAVVIFAAIFIVCLTMIWQERKTLGRIMDRRATQVGPLGYFQNLADGMKTMVKEIIIPDSADRMAYDWAVTIVIGTGVLLAGMVPLSDRFFLADYGTGLLIIFAIFSLAPFAILIAGWAQNNKYTLIGGMRACAQMISYEVPMLMILVATVLLAGSLNINDIVAAQQDSTWFFIPQILGLFTFLVAAVAEAERIPFDLPEAEAELVEGWQTEYGGMRWGLIMLGDYFRGYVAASLGVIMFFGGWDGPYLPPEIWFLIKVFIIFFGMIWVRGSLHRIRTDQILNIGWKRLLPLAILNLLVVVTLKVWGVY